MSVFRLNFPYGVASEFVNIIECICPTQSVCMGLIGRRAAKITAGREFGYSGFAADYG
ncbi:hypothetical protein [Candidatus Desulfovibrio trichonymphae]|uniref:hypothetical protein n=1 Tax=Candidatus Desulfovibrio trichonymphae TaxID=1725232 RepID=UPI001E4F60A0|nr:hypothetical protein [Candidatus Desulfovibrio trichonymphae]GHU91220.1 hypothetical protein AGMMS49925_05580 [Deltaproteobacteria bacterium]GHU94807.1 hypothetical protein AGMMS49974_04920 [Deltaproteobacteria bacterium]